MSYQTTVSQSPQAGLPGTAALTTTNDKVTMFAENNSGGATPVPGPGIMPGRLTVRGTEQNQAALPEANVLDADAIVINGASAVTEQVYAGVLLDGVIGATRWALPSKVDAIVDSNTDWDATNATLVGIDSNGSTVSETIAIPNDGNATVSSTNDYVQVISFTVPIQTGAAGTFTLGVQASVGDITKNLVQGIAFLDPRREGGFDLNGIPVVGVENGLPYIDGDDFAAWRRGHVWVATEDQCAAGAPVFVRTTDDAVSGQPSTAGAFRSDADSGAAVLLEGARYYKVVGNLATVEISFAP